MGTGHSQGCPPADGSIAPMASALAVPDSGRLFLALCPDERVRAALAAHAQAWQWNAGAARYAPADWHITLHFIGAVARQRLDALRAGLAVPMTPFALRLGAVELWPHGLAVVLPETVPAGLQQLHARLGQALQDLGRPPDPRPYRPHLTLARRARLAQPPAVPLAIDWPVDSYALMTSSGQPQLRYRLLQRYGGSA